MGLRTPCLHHTATTSPSITQEPILQQRALSFTLTLGTSHSHLHLGGQYKLPKLNNQTDSKVRRTRGMDFTGQDNQKSSFFEKNVCTDATQVPHSQSRDHTPCRANPRAVCPGLPGYSHTRSLTSVLSSCLLVPAGTKHSSKPKHSTILPFTKFVSLGAPATFLRLEEGTASFEM